MSSIPGNLFQLQNVFVTDLMSELVPVRNRHKNTFFFCLLIFCLFVSGEEEMSKPSVLLQLCYIAPVAANFTALCNTDQSLNSSY